MLRIGHYQELKVNREVDFGIYVGDGKDEVLLPTKYIPEGTEIGDDLRVFVYKDSEGRPIATTLDPKGVLGDIVALQVTDTNPHGAFMEWGIAKDLFVPRVEQSTRFQEGEMRVIRIAIDHKTNRLIGTDKLNAFIEKDTSELQEGEQVDLLVYQRSDLGWKAVINGRFSGLIYAQEAPATIKIGQSLKGYIRQVRPDGKVDLRLSAEGRRAVDDGRQVIIDYLQSNDGVMQITDKSSPEEIFEAFQMSKKLFKKTIGALYRERVVQIENDQITLIN